MTIKHIKLTNIRGLLPIDQDLPAICFIQGANEQGKTAFISSILYLWEKGHDDAMITIGADKGEIVATMEDGLQVRALLTRGQGTERMTKKPGAKKWTTSRAEIDALVNGIGYNPLEFMGMKPKEQLALLLKLMPATVTEEEILATLKPLANNTSKDLTARLMAAGGAGDSLSRIASIRTTIYDERTGINRAADTQKKHAEELEASLGPVGEEKDWGVEVGTIEGALHSATEAKANVQQGIIDTVNVEIGRFKDVMEREIAGARKKCDEAIEESRMIANRRWAGIEPIHEQVISELMTNLATARERDRLSASHAATRNAVQVARQSSTQMTKQSKALTEAITNLDTLQATVAERLPIPGIRFIDGELHNEQGVPFRTWNTATQTFFCLRLALLMKTSFIILDRGLEVLDPGNKKLFLERAQQLAGEENIQFFVASITADPKLSVGEIS